MWSLRRPWFERFAQYPRSTTTLPNIRSAQFICPFSDPQCACVCAAIDFSNALRARGNNHSSPASVYATGLSGIASEIVSRLAAARQLVVAVSHAARSASILSAHASRRWRRLGSSSSSSSVELSDHTPRGKSESLLSPIVLTVDARRPVRPTRNQMFCEQFQADLRNRFGFSIDSF